MNKFYSMFTLLYHICIMSGRKRSPNFTGAEKSLLIQLVDSFNERIENKKTDVQSKEDKRKAWDELTLLFNAHSSHEVRNAAALKGLWDNLKRDGRKVISTERQALITTGEALVNCCFLFHFTSQIHRL